MTEHLHTLPNDFLFGAATAAYQVEGAAREDGRGPSIWDTFSHSPGRTYGGDTGDVSVDQYHRIDEDVALMKRMGVGAYRFSVSWSRVMPEGEGRINEAGIGYYAKLVDSLLSAGIEPWITLFHWDLPQALQDNYGGWQSRETSKRFYDYAALMASRLGDRVANWFPMNEMFCFTVLGHREGVHAPGLTLSQRETNQVCHHALLGHGYGVKAIRDNAPGARVGCAEHMHPAVPVMETEEHIDAARRAFRIENARFLTAIVEGRYIDEYIEAEGADAPSWEDGDFDLIGQPLDFIGMNMYCPSHIIADPNAPHGFRQIPTPRSYPAYHVPWLKFDPQVTYWLPRLAKEVYNAPEIYITENGACCDDRMSPDGEVYDTDRVLYLRESLKSVSRCVKEGYPLKGYFLWSFVDNFEWAEGYSKRFGIHFCNYETKERTPKLSAKWYREVIRRGRVV